MRDMAKYRAWRKAFYAARKMRGVCLHHPNRRVESGHVTCKECLEDKRLRGKLR
jgi:hypothetical protein